MILHLLTEGHFADYPIRQFSSSEMCSEFVMIPDNPDMVTSFQKNHCRIVAYKSLDFQEMLKGLGCYKAIFLHGLFSPWVEEVLKSVPQNVKVAWYFWGGEIYSRYGQQVKFLAPITRLAYGLHRIKSCKIDSKPTWELTKSLFLRINYCLSSIHEEYMFAKKFLNHESLEYGWYTYYTIEETVGKMYNQKCIGDDILFCNSAAIENNMFDAIFFLYRIKIKNHLVGRRIIMPMGYGSPWVKNSMIKIGRFLFGNSFFPITDYLPRDIYNSMMTQCSTLILPYWSPAGQGNILTGLWLGMRVYLSEKSMAFAFFKRIGVNVFSLEKDFKKYYCSRLTREEIDANKVVIRNLYSKEHVEKSTLDLVKLLTM